MKILISLSLTDDAWWKSLTRNQQTDYLKEHPNSKYARNHKSKAEPKEDETPTITQPANTSAALTRADDDRTKWPEHIKALKLPPAWQEIHYSDDKDAALQATGLDEKGRKQFVYSAEFEKKQSALKFARVKELDAKFKVIDKENSAAIASNDSKKREHAECLALIMKVGLRPGSDVDTKAEKKAYGATNLRSNHVVEDNGTVYLRFTGKKGVPINLPVKDKQLAQMLKERKKAAGDDGRLFKSVNEKTLSSYTHSLDGGGFKTKDFRTRLGCKTAEQIILKYDPKPKTPHEYKKAVRHIAVEVSKKLGNTPLVALQSYIAPQVFADWKSNIPGLSQ